MATTVDLAASPTSGTAPLTVTFTVTPAIEQRTIDSVLWTCVEKPSGAGDPVFANAAALTTTVTCDTAGNYVLRLTVTVGATVVSDDTLLTISSGGVAAPTLSAISNADLDGNYTVTWSVVAGATYTLQEDDNASFTSPATAYSGSNLSLSVVDKANGTYYYRVRATIGGTDSAWSTVRSVVVSVAAGPAILWYDFTTNAANTQGNSYYDLTPDLNAPDYGANGAVFDVVNAERLKCGNPWPTHNAPLTVAFWLYAPNGSTAYSAHVGAGGTFSNGCGFKFSTISDGGTGYFSIYSGTSNETLNTSNTQVTLNASGWNWVALALDWPNDKVRLYYISGGVITAKTEESLAAYTPSGAPAANPTIGGGLAGNVQSFAIFNTYAADATDANLVAHYNGGTPIAYASFSP